jgi:DNA-directed RNA polymerase specialized sigma24 family protein
MSHAPSTDLLDTLTNDLFVRLRDEEISYEELESSIKQSAEMLVAAGATDIKKMLTGLPTLDRDTQQTLRLRLEGCCSEDIAKRQSISEEDVRRRLTRAYVSLRSYVLRENPTLGGKSVTDPGLAESESAVLPTRPLPTSF